MSEIFLQMLIDLNLQKEVKQGQPFVLELHGKILKNSELQIIHVVEVQKNHMKRMENKGIQVFQMVKCQNDKQWQICISMQVLKMRNMDIE